ncbi:uncharacterized protein [Onthophagus taurus]|uniref:uncharacterized protein n=1 Tax=Onthophagus taurus TaxID=166361 RepID=UPI0039BEA699
MINLVLVTLLGLVLLRKRDVRYVKLLGNGYSCRGLSIEGVWRDSPSEEIKTYELTTVTYGLNCAPFLAIRCLRLLAEQHSSDQPNGAAILLKDTYVDDILSGADSVSEAQKVISQVQTIVMAGCFHARKWMSNHPDVLVQLSPSDDSHTVTVDLRGDDAPRALGLIWNNETDEFLFVLSQASETLNRLTKRSVLSFIARLYDPLGLLSPFIITAKIYMQELWILGLDWDEEFPSDLTKNWISFLKDFHNVPAIRVPRWIGTHNNTNSVEIHGFADASVRAFGAVVYLRVVDDPGLARGSLSPAEIDFALLFWVREEQRIQFQQEIHDLKAGKPISKSSPLFRLTPFIDGNDILRITGRLRFASLDWDEKHPMIIPKTSHLTTLIIDSHHRRTFHGGTQLTLSYIRRRFWIVGGRIPVRSFIQQCIVCVRLRAETSQQLMGQLPPARVIPSRPFLHTGVDYAGPFLLTTFRGRATSAIHLEVATDYSTAGFMAAYKRFTARRGLCQCLYSDCGTNLVGADRELRSLFSAASKDGTGWKFNPPAAPHFGGKWEAGVRSVKNHLRKVVGSTLLTYEEFTTVLIEIEAILNSRPLCAVSDDPSNYDVITSSHFLIGSSGSVVPEPSLLDEKVSRLTRYQHLRRLVEEFWKRWKDFYLQSVQNSTKWFKGKNLPAIGDLVLVKDERLPPSKWLLARITELHPGKDGLVRVATIKTSTTTLVRPLVKLCLLPC